MVAIMGIVIGIAVAFIVYAIHRFFPTTAAIDAALTLITPYIMYITAEHFIIPVFYRLLARFIPQLSFAGNIQYESRLNVAGLWDTLIFLLNGFVFILIGLQLPTISQGLGNYSIGEAIFMDTYQSSYNVIRIVWVFPGAYLPRFYLKVFAK